jgi:hypothetical protein
VKKTFSASLDQSALSLLGTYTKGVSEEQAMTEADWNPWKMTTLGLLLAGVTALVTTLVMGYRADREDVKQGGAVSHANASVRKASVQSQVDVEACQASAQQRAEDKTIGTLYGLNNTTRRDAQYQAAYRSCMRHKGY